MANNDMGLCPVCDQPISNGKHTQISMRRPVGVNVAESRWYCGTAAQYAEEQSRAPTPTRSYRLEREALTTLLAQDAQTRSQRFFNEVLGEPFESEKEPLC